MANSSPRIWIELDPTKRVNRSYFSSISYEVTKLWFGMAVALCGCVDTPFSTVSALPLRIVLQTAEHAGVDVNAVLAEAGVNPEHLMGFAPRLTYVEVAAVCAALEVHAKGIPLAILAVDQLGEGAFGVIESVGYVCGTLRNAAHLLSKLVRIVGDGLGFELRDNGRTATFIHVPHPGHPIPPVLAELTMLAIGRISRRLSERELRATQIRFTHARSPHASQLEAFFGAPVVFGASEIALEFPAIYLDLPLHRQHGSVEDLEARVRAFLSVLPTEEGLLSRLRAWVAQRLQEEPSLSDAARELGLGPRTLQRRLRDFGTSFQSELDSLRRQIGKQRVLVTPSVGELAASLGFRDASAFTRAFRRWTGESPRDFRARTQLAKSA